LTEILCVGNPIVDVFIDIDKNLALKYGITDFTQHITNEQVESIFSEPSIDFSKVERSSGGGAANVAKITAMLGMNTVFSGCTGRDDLASVFEDEITSAGVSAKLIKSDNKTGVCFACNIARDSPPQEAGVLRFAACPGAALDLTEADINDEMISGAEVIVLDGYILNRRPLVQHILLKASRSGIPVALDAASVFQVKAQSEYILNLSRNFPLFIFMNADETIAFYNTIKKINDGDSGAKLINMTEKEKEMLIIREVSPILKIITEGEIYPILVIKLGGRGAIVFAGGHTYREETFAITPRSTVGAGDAFCAAFISAWIRGKSLSECAALGNKVAREILEVPGTRIKSGKLKSFAKYLQK